MSLTPKQEKFCQGIVSGMSAKDAYYAAYDTKCGVDTAYTEASKLMLREDIQKRIETMRKPLEQAAVQTAMTEREKKRAVLWNIIETGTPADQCRALDILNRMDAEYLNVNVNKTESTVSFDNIDINALRTLSEQS